MKDMEALIENQRNLIEKLSKIDLTKDETEVFKTAKEYLEITDENKGGIVSIWLEKKKEKFKNFILNKIIIDPNLPIYSQKLIFTGIVNYSLLTLDSLDSVCTIIKEQWIKIEMGEFLQAIFKGKNINKYKNGEKFFLQFYNKKFEIELINVFIKYFRPMINDILNAKINDPNNRFISFGFIRRMTDCFYNEDISGLSTNYYIKLISNVFSNSRRLIRNLFAFEFIKSLELFQIKNIPSGELEVDNGIFEYNYNNNIIIRFKPKKKGINSGFVLDIIKTEENNKSEIVLKSFYVKKYHGNSKSTSKNPEEKHSGTFLSISPISFNASLRLSSTKSERKGRKFDLKEPFLYATLNLLNFVPEVKFFINPYTFNGFYIATKNIFDQKNSFLPLTKLSIKMLKDNYNFIKDSLNQIDFISRIFLLRDLHNDNFGFVVENDQQIFKSLAIIDFVHPSFMESYKISSEQLIKDFLNCNYSQQSNEGIRILNLDDSDLNETGKFMKNEFLKAEEKIRVLNGFNSLEKFKNRIKAVELNQIDISKIERKEFKDEEPDDLLDEKFRNILFIKSQDIKNLMLQKRGIENKPEEYMLKHPKTNKPRTNAELIGFKLEKTKEEDLNLLEGQLDNLDKAFEDLDNYCQSIMYNYKSLKKSIIEHYNKYTY